MTGRFLPPKVTCCLAKSRKHAAPKWLIRNTLTSARSTRASFPDISVEIVGPVHQSLTWCTNASALPAAHFARNVTTPVTSPGFKVETVENFELSSGSVESRQPFQVRTSSLNPNSRLCSYPFEGCP